MNNVEALISLYILIMSGFFVFSGVTSSLSSSEIKTCKIGGFYVFDETDGNTDNDYLKEIPIVNNKYCKNDNCYAMVTLIDNNNDENDIYSFVKIRHNDHDDYNVLNEKQPNGIKCYYWNDSQFPRLTLDDNFRQVGHSLFRIGDTMFKFGLGIISTVAVWYVCMSTLKSFI